MSRYEIINSIKQNHYLPKCPLLILNYALTRDKELDSILAQIKFQSVTEKVIKAVYIKVSCYDIENIWLADLNEYTYLDLNVAVGKIWGSDKAVYLPDKKTRNIKIICTKILFDDGTSWIQDEDTAYIPEPNKQHMKDVLVQELYEEFISEIDDPFLKHRDLYQIESIDDIWTCPCGSCNYIENKKCWSCGHDLAYWEKLSSKENLQYNLNRRIEQSKIEAVRKAEEDKKLELKNQKIKKTIFVVSSVAIIMLALIIGVLKIVSKQQKEQINSLIAESKTNIQPYVDYIGKTALLDNLVVSQHWIDNSTKVKLMGKEGTISHRFSDQKGFVIDIMDWVSNEAVDDKDFEKYIQLLNKYFSEEAEIKSYDNLSDETYVWRDMDNKCWVMGWQDGNCIRLRWYDASIFE